MSPPPEPTEPSPTSQPSPPPLTQQERQELNALRSEKAALAMYVWELVRLAAPETHDVEVSPNPSDPLWHLAFVQPSSGSSGKVRILAGTIKPITEQEKKRVVRLLRETDKTMIDALKELKLDHFPPSYVEKQIEAHLKWHDGGPQLWSVWQSVKPESVGEKLRKFVGMT